MPDFFQKLFNIQPIIGITINTVPTKINLVLIIYAILLLSLLISFYIYYFRKRLSLINALRRSFIVALITSSTLWWINGETLWFSWLKDHWKHFKDLNTEEKLLKLEYPFYDFVWRLKKLIPEDSSYTIYSSDEYYAKRLEYFLLPRKKKDPSEFIVVLVDRETVFDPFSGVLKRRNEVITNLEPFFFYSEDAYMVRRR